MSFQTRISKHSPSPSIPATTELKLKELWLRLDWKEKVLLTCLLRSLETTIVEKKRKSKEQRQLVLDTLSSLKKLVQLSAKDINTIKLVLGIRSIKTAYRKSDRSRQSR